MRNKYMLGMKYVSLLFCIKICSTAEEKFKKKYPEIYELLKNVEEEKNSKSFYNENLKKEAIQKIYAQLQNLEINAQNDRQKSRSDNEILHKRMDKECKMNGWTKTLIIGSCVSVCLFSFVIWKLYRQIFY